MTTPFHDLADYMAIPRVGTVTLSPDGTWLAATVQRLSPDKKKYLTSIWRIDTGQDRAARRLTRSAEGEASPAFLPSGDLLFVSRRPDPEADKDSGSQPALWRLPATGGEAELIASRPGGVAGLATARDSDQVVISVPVLPGVPADEDKQRRKEREDAGVSAILHESAPVRYWDHDLGPDQLRLFALPSGADLTPSPGRALDEQAFALSPDGAYAVTGWWRHDPAGDTHAELVRIETATGERTTLLGDPGRNYEQPQVSPDGRFIACVAETLPTLDVPANVTLVVLDAAKPGTPPRDLLEGLDRWPAEFAWSADSGTVYFTADDNGRRPVFAVGLGAGTVARITHTDAAYLSLNADRAGRYLYALKTAVGMPPTPVRIDAATGAEQVLDCPGTNLDLPGQVTELETTADDGQRVRSWLVLPEAADRAPLLLWAHGGPHSSWNTWSWRWNPWLMAARGYAVLLPDPALSTGYGQRMMERGHHAWASRAFHDLMAITDVAVKHPRIDETRTAMMGGSYGGYLANWIAGHTGRFKAIVTHASLWALDQMFATTDVPVYWRGQFGDPLTNPAKYRDNSPHLHIGAITTPMLVIHGDKDYRVPIGEALRLWGELTRHGVPARFLYFPDENHWILTPGNATVWYETVFAFLAEHVLGEAWHRPRLL